MIREREITERRADRHMQVLESSERLKFAANDGFQIKIRRRVDDYFRKTGLRQRDSRPMYLKTAIHLAVFAATYVLLVFVAQTWWQGLSLAILFGLELVGGSSYVWHWKHGVIHHTYVNITGHDTDIDVGFLARLTPHQKRLKFHCWQHIYF